MENVTRTSNKELMTKAREAMSGNWGLGIGAMLLHLLITIGVQVIPVAGAIASLLISGAFTLGFAILYLSIVRKGEPQLSMIFKGFEKFGTALGAFLLQGLFVILWMLLFIIPGIIAAFSYTMTFYIIADDDSVGALEAISRSKEMMRGNKWKLFCLGCRFIGWAILCLFTLGIGFLWLGPYMSASTAEFYEDIRGKKEELEAPADSLKTETELV